MRWLTTPVLNDRVRAPFWLLVAVTATGTLAMHLPNNWVPSGDGASADDR